MASIVLEDLVTDKAVLRNNVVSKSQDINNDNDESYVLHDFLEITGAYKEADSTETVGEISRFHEYYYTLKIGNPKKINIKKINWGISYDKSKQKYFLFSGGTLIENDTLLIKLKVAKGVNKFTLYASPNRNFIENVSLDIYFKKSCVFVVGGAGDKRKFLGIGPTTIVDRKIVDVFFNNKTQGMVKDDINIHYLGYYELFGSKLRKEVISKIPSIKSDVNFIGHSLGGWNSAYASSLLNGMGYEVNILITLDPVGVDPTVRIPSDIYNDTPNPISETWIDIFSNPDNFNFSDFIADFGVQWIPEFGLVDYYEEVGFSHEQAGKMYFDTQLDNAQTPHEMLCSSIKEYLETK